MANLKRHIVVCTSILLFAFVVAGCKQGEPPAPANVDATKATPALPVKPKVLSLTLERISSLAPMADHSPMTFGEAPKESYSWRFGSSEDDLVIWASFEPEWSTTEFSNVILTSGYTIESDLASELDVAAAILEMDRSELDKKIMPMQKIGGIDMKVFGKGEFTSNGLSVHYNFEDNSGINGHTKPDLMIAILPESYRTFSIEKAKNQKDVKK